MRPFLFLLLATVPVYAQGLWETRAPYPIAVTEVSGAAIGTKIYSMCGLAAGPQRPRNLFIYDTVYDLWSEGAPYPIDDGADHCNVAAVDGKLYLLGAIRTGTGFVDGTTYMYDPATNAWQAIGQMGTPRGASGVAAIGTRIYVAGGLRGGGGSSNAFEVFDTGNRQWTVLPNMPTLRDHLTAQAVGGKFYALTGRASIPVDNTEEYDPTTAMWRQRAPIPVARGGIGSGVIDGRIVVFGGEGQSPNAFGTFNDVHAYDPASDTWLELPEMPTARHGLYGIVVANRLFAPGGGPRAGAFFSDVHEVFYPSPTIVPQVAAADVRNAASFTQALAPGALFSVFGEHLSFGLRVADLVQPWPERLNALELRVDGLRVPILFTAPNQINAQLPFNLPLTAPTVQVSNAGTSGAVVRIGPLQESAPGIFSMRQDGTGQGAILIANTPLLAAPNNEFGEARAVRRGEGEFIEIYCTGLGRVNIEAEPGVAAPASPLAETLLPARVTIGGVEAAVSFAGLAPNYVALYQVNAQVAANTPVGPTVPVVLRMGEGLESNTVTIAVGN